MGCVSAKKGKLPHEASSHPVVVFSKTYCPYASKAVEALDNLNVQYNLIQLDEIDNGPNLQEALFKATGQKTVPNIFIGGQHVGGSGDLETGLQNGSVQKLLQKHKISYAA